MDAPAFRQRLAGASGSLLLQGGFLLLFLYSLPQITRPMETGREMIYVLRRPVPPAASSPAPSRTRTAPAALVPAPPVEAPPAAVIAPPAALPDFEGFGQALNDCAPERYARLRPEERVRCPPPAAMPPDSLTAPPSLVKDETHWQAEFAREQSPFLLPCTSVYGDAAGINFYCLAVMAAHGTLTDTDNWPVYGASGN